MGLFRLTLALCVVLGHGLNLPIPAATPDIAVQTFYIVSGFYMALVLTERYHSLQSFFGHRVLRLYPAYAAVAAVTLAHALLRWSIGRSSNLPGLLSYETHFAPLDLGAKAYLVLTNLLLAGQDVAMFLKISGDGGSFQWTTNFLDSMPRVETFLLVPQSWSLSIELGFYLCAPWLVRRSTTALLGMFAATIALRFVLAAQGLNFDPWTYRFFPVELGSFVLGILLYRSMRHRRATVAMQRLALAMLIAATLLLSALPDSWATRIVFYGYVAWALPLAFQLTRRSAIDRYIGELSYPVYLVHLLVISIALYSGWSGPRLAALIVVMVGGSAVLLHEVVQKPVDRLRAARVR
jgi:peptidoglycan/LPS O-acetylase OafA/YrhL